MLYIEATKENTQMLYIEATINYEDKDFVWQTSSMRVPAKSYECFHSFLHSNWYLIREGMKLRIRISDDKTGEVLSFDVD